MREVKFRAWDSKRSNMMYQDSDDFAVMNSGQHDDGVFYGRITYGPWPDDSSLRDWEVILMQYTGLKDKNGVDIYEGDFIRGKAYYQYGIVDTEVAPITFDAPVFKCGDINLIMNTGTTDPSLEVIGNIYENPELLEKSA